MIERVARALCDNQESHELNWEAWAHAARAVLREMREPTEAMVSKGTEQIDWWRGTHETSEWAAMPEGSTSIEDDTAEAWSTMIDEALSESVR